MGGRRPGAGGEGGNRRRPDCQGPPWGCEPRELPEEGLSGERSQPARDRETPCGPTHTGNLLNRPTEQRQARRDRLAGGCPGGGWGAGGKARGITEKNLSTPTPVWR